MATPILNVIIADVNAIVPNLTSLVSSYRLLVGAAEEISRSPGVPREVYERSVIRYDRAGTLIDILLELLCCKIRFLAEFLSVTCAPIDIFSLAQNPLENTTTEEIIELEVLRRILDICGCDRPCFDPPEGLDPDCGFPCPKPSGPSPAGPGASGAPSVTKSPSMTIPVDNEAFIDLLTEAGIIVPPGAEEAIPKSPLID